MKLKILIVTALLVSIIMNMAGCDAAEDFFAGIFTADFEYEGVKYSTLSMKGHEPYLTAVGLAEDCEKEIVYVYDEIRGIPVTTTGLKAYMSDQANFYNYKTDKIKRIYFPWSIKSRAQGTVWDSSLEYVFSPSTTQIIDAYALVNFVVPKSAYDTALETNCLGERLYHGTDNLTPANISFFFNYENNPNEGYFFIDLLEESGKLNKLPYDPKREEYIFDGWYKETECINEWNFDTDIATIEYDENGERIYEEICLYAKWMRKFY